MGSRQHNGDAECDGFLRIINRGVVAAGYGGNYVTTRRSRRTESRRVFCGPFVLANIAGSMWRPLLPLSLPAPSLGAVLWERFTPQFPFYIPLVATLLLLPIMWLKFKLPPSNPEADQGGEPAG